MGRDKLTAIAIITLLTANAIGIFILFGQPTRGYALDDHVAGANLPPTQAGSLPGCPPKLVAAFKGAPCGPMAYHGGPVMHNPTDYLIFWLPSGFHYDGNDQNYETLISRYFQDVGNSAFYNILNQYTDKSGPPGPSSYGGSWVDTKPYPSTGSTHNPMDNFDFQNEVLRAMSVNHWSSNGGNNEFFVFTGLNVFSCFNTVFANLGCFPNDYCDYHSFVPLWGGKILPPPGSLFTIIPSQLVQGPVFAVIPDSGSTGAEGCLASRSPNGDLFADSAISDVSHEQFESISDPYVLGVSANVVLGVITSASVGSNVAWYYGSTIPGSLPTAFGITHEIADECAGYYGPGLEPDGSNVVLNGHPYIVQFEWSNTIYGLNRPPGCTLDLHGPPLLVTVNLSPTNLLQQTSPPPNGFQITYQESGENTPSSLATAISGPSGSFTLSVFVVPANPTISTGSSPQPNLVVSPASGYLVEWCFEVKKNPCQNYAVSVSLYGEVVNLVYYEAYLVSVAPVSVTFGGASIQGLQPSQSYWNLLYAVAAVAAAVLAAISVIVIKIMRSKK